MPFPPPPRPRFWNVAVMSPLTFDRLAGGASLLSPSSCSLSSLSPADAGSVTRRLVVLMILVMLIVLVMWIVLGSGGKAYRGGTRARASPPFEPGFFSTDTFEAWVGGDGCGSTPK